MVRKIVLRNHSDLSGRTATVTTATAKWVLLLRDQRRYRGDQETLVWEKHM
jgi:hypothetical protein